MAAAVVAPIAAAHDTERRRHGALTRDEDRIHQQHLGLWPAWAAEQRYEGIENGYNGIGQGEHGLAFSQIWIRASLPRLDTFSEYCVESSKYLRRLAIQVIAFQ